MRHIGGADDNVEVQLAEKERDLEDLEDLYQALMIKERSINDELQEGRKVLIKVSFLSSSSFLFLF